MASLRHSGSAANLSADKQCHQRSASKMKISRSAPDLLRRAATSLKSKTEALRTKLMILASLRRRMAMAAMTSRGIHALVSSGRPEKQARVERGDVKALVPMPCKEAAGGHGGSKVGLRLFEVAVYEEDDHGYPPAAWIKAFFDDDNCYGNEEEGVHDDEDDLDLDALDEPSAMDIVRRNREAEGLEFNMDEDIDEACDIFIRRFRSRINRSF